MANFVKDDLNRDDNDDVKSEKGRVRKIVRERLNAMSVSNRESESVFVCHEIEKSLDFQEADLILMYLSLPQELCLDSLFENHRGIENKKEFYVPVCKDGEGQMDFYLLDRTCSIGEQTVSGMWGIRELGDASTVLDFSAMNGKKILVLVPGVAFDHNGTRVGKGKGYYDRYLSMLKKNDIAFTSFGVCFACQVQESLPAAENDMSVSKIVFRPADVTVDF